MTVEITEAMIQKVMSAGIAGYHAEDVVKAVAPEIERAVTIRIAERLKAIADHAEVSERHIGHEGALVDLTNRVDALRESLDGSGDPIDRYYNFPMEGD